MYELGLNFKQPGRSRMISLLQFVYSFRNRNMICPVVMAGGTGSRLWPLSRQLNPKQFLALTDDNKTMLQA